MNNDDFNSGLASSILALFYVISYSANCKVGLIATGFFKVISSSRLGGLSTNLGVLSSTLLDESPKAGDWLVI